MEDMWIDKEIEERRRILDLPSSEQGFALRGLPMVRMDAADEIIDPQQRIQEALDYAEYESEQMSGILENDATDLITTRIQALYRGGIRCQLCMMYAWNEQCYMHDMAECDRHVEGPAAKALLAKWSNICAYANEYKGRSQKCGFPPALCCVQPQARMLYCRWWLCCSQSPMAF